MKDNDISTQPNFIFKIEWQQQKNTNKL